MYLTKSRFKIGISCPTKLYYESNPQQFNKEMTKKNSYNDFMKMWKYIQNHYYKSANATFEQKNKLKKIMTIFLNINLIN